MITLLDLPVELKIKIFNQLSGYDKLQLIKTCPALENVCLCRDIVHSLDFSRNYRLQVDDLKFFKTQPTCLYITKLNLNGVYWISSVILKNTLMKFTNLVELHVIDTKFTITHLHFILNNYTKKVRKLSFTFKRYFLKDFEEIQIPITHLFVVYKSYAVCKILGYIFSDFIPLDELWLIETNMPSDRPKATEYWELTLQEPKNLFLMSQFKKLVLGKLSGSANEKLQLYELFDNVTINWRNIYKYQNHQFLIYENTGHSSDSLKIPQFYTADQLRFIDCVSAIQRQLNMCNMFSVHDNKKMMVKKLAAPDLIFKSLNLVRIKYCGPPNLQMAPDLFEMFLFHPNLKYLRKLTADSFVFWENNILVKSIRSLRKRQRVCVSSKQNDGNNMFTRFTKHTPDMEDFVLNDLSDGLDRWQPDCLKHIKNWSILKKLSIQSVNLTSGNFLIEVTKHCKLLEVLKLKIDSKLDLTLDITTAMKSAKNLRDFRYETRGEILFNDLIKSLTKRKSLERVYIQSQSVNLINELHIQNLINKCTNLVLFYVFIIDIPARTSKAIGARMRANCDGNKQFFHIQGLDQDPEVDVTVIDDVMPFKLPSVHQNEMINHSNEIYFDYLHEFSNST